jgi:hypothetical protein
MSSRLREELRGRGNLYQGDTLIVDVTYEVHVFQESVEKNTRQVSEQELKACYGYLYSSGYLLHLHLGQEMTLHLEDGRYLDCVAEAWNRGRLEITCKKLYS